MISNGGLQWTPICADCKNYETVNIFNVGSFSYGQTIVFFECICDLPFTNEEEYMEQWAFETLLQVVCHRKWHANPKY